MLKALKRAVASEAALAKVACEHGVSRCERNVAIGVRRRVTGMRARDCATLWTQEHE